MAKIVDHGSVTLEFARNAISRAYTDGHAEGYRSGSEFGFWGGFMLGFAVGGIAVIMMYLFLGK